MPKVEIDMSYEQIAARKQKLEKDLIDIEYLISKREEMQAELNKWEALEAKHRPKREVDPLEGLPKDTEEYKKGKLKLK